MSQSHKWETLNLPSSEPVPDVSGPFTIRAEPNTDLWRSTPERDVSNGPAIITKTTSAAFERAQVTLSYDNFVTTYDQGGLYFSWPTEKSKPSWIKVGVEFEQGEPQLSSVGTHHYSDWALTPIVTSGPKSVTIEAVKQSNAIWFYAIFANGKRQPLRELKWAFLDDRSGDAELWVGAGAAKPTPEQDPTQVLEVKFENLVVETTS
ncbi:hypothetical protein K431DRAFT_287345 [Polychaeton citri CBS 116435]|uniref:Uncharacterized protein n=1 Tax=Polychaeton citri CBS 116435 TaxID=1314669 RepID=A0A9P4Q5D1_9PEZI|nr:hypothetical protein K431DRAFT_287345 [Polychaeton citri CBS 116435]